jgi:hypothetical protein
LIFVKTGRFRGSDHNITSASSSQLGKKDNLLSACVTLSLSHHPSIGHRHATIQSYIARAYPGARAQSERDLHSSGAVHPSIPVRARRRRRRDGEEPGVQGDAAVAGGVVVRRARRRGRPRRRHGRSPSSPVSSTTSRSLIPAPLPSSRLHSPY